ncbi:MAG TPA: hypothetical protein VFN23_16920 [Ktedonobacteraceae bacterium]|nr:hypothetical protein [Ktedonobacteraceae bacterium]
MSNTISEQLQRVRIFRVAVIIGLCLGILQSIVWLFSEPLQPGVTSSPSFIAFLYLVAPVIWAIVFLLLGIWVGKITGLVSQSSLAGLFSGIFGSLTAAIGHVLVFTLALSSSNGSQPLLTGYYVLAVVAETLILVLGAGAGFSAIGGLIGQYLSPNRPQPATRRVPPPAGPPPFPYYPPQFPNQPMPQPMPQE